LLVGPPNDRLGATAQEPAIESAAAGLLSRSDAAGPGKTSGPRFGTLKYRVAGWQIVSRVAAGENVLYDGSPRGNGLFLKAFTKRA
jgi:hypothetical protein